VKRAISSSDAPPSAGTYSQAILASGKFLFVSGQTPRLPSGERLVNASFERQVIQTMDNVKAIAAAANYDLQEDCVQLTVYLRDLDDRSVFDEVYSRYVGSCPPARAVVQSTFVDFDIEIAAVLVR